MVTAEFKINFLRPALGEYFLAIGNVRNAGKSLTVCTGEVHAFDQAKSEDRSLDRSSKVIALMQATMVIVGGNHR